MIQLTSTADVQNYGVKMLVYAGAGKGKTRLLLTLPNVVIGSAEGGTLSIREANLPKYEIRNMQELDTFYRWNIQSHEARQFQSIGLDSISEIAEKVLAYEMSVNKDPRKAYGEMANQVMNYLRLFRDIPGKHVYMSAKMTRVKDEQTGAITWGPMMPGQQLDQQLPYMFDEVFHLENFPDPNRPGETFGALRTRADNQYQAKDRSGALAPWEQPHLGQIISKITGR